jgi:large subunit ribosomal protein L34e
MPARRLRSRSFRRVFRKVPGGRTSLHYKQRKPKSAHCADCRAVLKGTIRERPYKMRAIAKTKKRPQRPFGGMLCSRCMRLRMIEKARQ